MRIQRDNPSRPPVAALLREHLDGVSAVSPAESVHALGVRSLCAANITFWTAAEGEDVLGCGALLELDAAHGEIKSMRTAAGHLRKGVASAVLTCIIAEARARSYGRLSLETGSQPFFAPARTLYARFGFVPCEPFADYTADPNSVCMTRVLTE